MTGRQTALLLEMPRGGRNGRGNRSGSTGCR